jgi:hypothetical protein
MTRILATILSVAIFGAVVALMAYVQRKAAPRLSMEASEYTVDGITFHII